MSHSDGDMGASLLFLSVDATVAALLQRCCTDGAGVLSL